jgi:hypothetical protein
MKRTMWSKREREEGKQQGDQERMSSCSSMQIQKVVFSLVGKQPLKTIPQQKLPTYLNEVKFIK